MSDERKNVTVICNHASGLQLRLYKNHHTGDAMGKMPDPKQDTVQLKGGSNQVDAGFLSAWLDENEGNDLLLNGTITIVEPKEKGEHDGEPGKDNVVERPDNESSVDAPAPDTEAKEEKPADA
jgi:hypothetical protein